MMKYFYLLTILALAKPTCYAQTYGFDAETIGDAPANITAANGTSEVVSFSGGREIEAKTIGSDAAAVFDLDLFLSSSDYTVTWNETYSSTGGRNGFILRGSGSNSSNAGAKTGYLFQTNPSLGNLRIYRSDAAGFVLLSTFSLTGPGAGVTRWYRASSCSTTHTLSYSADGVTFTSAISITDATYSSGTTQYSSGYGRAINNTHIDDIVFASCPVLPIGLHGFNAIRIDDRYALLEWQTAFETNNDYFTIERSLDGAKWEAVKSVDGAGNSSTPLNYTTTDYPPYHGLVYYRLKQTDFDDKFTYSKTVAIDLQNTNTIILYPEVTNNIITITGNEPSLKGISVLNSLGQEVTPKTSFQQQEKNKIIIDLSQLSPGLYFIKTMTTIHKVKKQ